MTHFERKNILLISYVFPPYPGIGGRRWAKFAKYLARDGHHVHVICAKNPFKEISQWNKDVSNISNLQVHELPALYPKWLLSSPKDLFEKAMYRLSLIFIKRMVKGNFYDRSALWENQLVKTSQNIIEEFDIQTIIVSGAPFHNCYFAAKIKQQYPGLKLIMDFRDPWMSQGALFGIGSLGKSRQDLELTYELKAVNGADVVITVADDMTNYFKNKSENPGTVFTTIRNGYDPDEIVKTPLQVIEKKEKLRFIYAGALYSHLDLIFTEFINTVAKLKTVHPMDYALLQFDFFGQTPNKYIEIVRQAGLQDSITFFGKVPLERVQYEISRSDLCMLFIMEAFEFSFSTKFYEYISQRKKIAVFSQPGPLTDYVLSNNIGYVFSYTTIAETLDQVISDFKKGEKEFPKEYDHEQFSCEKLAKEIIPFFK